jgi:uncharacterized membrane protein
MTDMSAPETDANSVTTLRRRWPHYLLIASLALNLLFVGMVTSAMWRGGWGTNRGNPSNIIGFIGQLPVERRTQLLNLSKDIRGEVRQLRQQVRQANADRTAALRADAFDKQRYVEAQTRQIEAETKVRLLMRTVLAETAASMTGDERRAFLRWRGPQRMLSETPDPDMDPPPVKR